MAEGWWQTNSLGARGKELDVTAETIFVMGDSNIAARFAQESESFPVHLAAQTSKQVANFGVPGYGPDQSVARLATLLSASKFTRLQAVILHVFADNDLGDLIRNALPRFDTYQDQASWRDPIFSYLGDTAGQSVFLRKVRNQLLKSRLGPWMAPDNYYFPPPPSLHEPGPTLIDKLVAEQLRSFTEYRKRRFTAWYVDYYDAAIALDADPELTKAAVGTLGRVFRTFLDLSRRHGFCPLVLIQPSEIDVARTNYFSADDLIAYARRHGHSYEQRRLTRLIEQAASEASVPALSLFDAFDGGAFYYTHDEMPGDNHWNPAGMAEAAKLAARYLGQSCIKGAQ